MAKKETEEDSHAGRVTRIASVDELIVDLSAEGVSSDAKASGARTSVMIERIFACKMPCCPPC